MKISHQFLGWRNRFKSIGWLACFALAGFVDLASAANRTAFFRSDLGLAAGVGSLPDRFDSSTKLRWRTPLDSAQSSAILWSNRIFLTSYCASNRELATVALDRDTGVLVWKQATAVPRIEELHPTMGNPATATPACDGERVYAFFGSFGVVCYELGGRKLWERSLGPFRDEYGASSSPVLVEGKLVLCQDHDIDSFLVALDARTGEEVWKIARPNAVRSYSTPAVWMVDGRPQLLVAGALELAGYNPTNGEKVWWVNGLARIVIPAPVPTGDTIFMASWTPGGDTGAKVNFSPWQTAIASWDKNGDGKLAKAEITDREVLSRYNRMDLDGNDLLDQAEWERHAAVFQKAENAALAIKPSGRGNLTEQAIRWKYPRGAPYVPTPLVINGTFWMVKDGGIVTRLDASTGKMISEERLPGGGNYYASPVAGDGKVYFASEAGVVSVVADEPAWRVISSNKFEAKIYGTPVLDRNRVLIRTQEALHCFEQPGSRD